MKKLIIPVLLLAFSLAAGEVKIDLSAVRPGGQAPKLVSDAAGNALEFTASGNSVTAAGIPQTFDFRQGGKIEFEFQDAEKQSNPFPRLLETGSVSLQFEAAPNAPGGDKILKVLLTDFNTKGIAQIKIPCPHKTGVWHKAVFEIDPSAKAFSLTLDGKQHRAPLSVSPRLENLQFILGASTLNNSPRGFSGRIRNIRIVTPHSMPAGGESAIMNQKVSPGVRHVRICAIKGRHYAFPGITRLPDGDLAAVFREGAGHVCPYGRICIAYSKDGGQNWSAPTAIFDTESDERDPSIQTLPDGRVLVTCGAWNSWMFYSTTASQFPSETAYIKQSGPEKFGGNYYLFSTDGGKSFGRPIRVPGFAPHGPAIMPDGTFLQPSLGNDNGKRQIYLFHGSANAENWRKTAVVAEMPRSSGALDACFEEPHTAVMPDGSLVTAIRIPQPGDGHMRISRSADGGKTWSTPVKTPVKGYPQHLRVLKDGRLLATYGYRYPPYGVRACISRDGGKTWDIDKEIILQNNGISDDLGYPVSIELENGEVLCVYYMNTAEHGDCFIEGAFFRP